MRQHLEAPPPPLPDAIPVAIRRLVLRLLAKEPVDRPQDGRAVVETLDLAIKRLGPAQEALREAALEAQQRRSVADGHRAAQAAKQATVAQHIKQALADLHYVLQEAAEQAREALSELRFRTNGEHWYLTWDRTLVAVDAWAQTPVPRASNDDLLVLAGLVHARRPTGQAPLANIVCELCDDRLQWSVLRFTASGLAGRYEYGPRDRPHGFHRQIFARQRAHMIRSGMHVWNMQRTPLTTDSVVELLREAISSG
jgi:hypothetical protein